jgi:hypothetical protein
MLPPPRALVRLSQCALSAHRISTSHQFSSFRPLLLPPNESNFRYIPRTTEESRHQFKESPVNPSSNGILEDHTPIRKNISVDNAAEMKTRRLAQTGKFSGRTVSCPKLQWPQALGKLNAILRDNQVSAEWNKSRVRLPPSEARRKLASKRHRIRFNQGVGRLVDIVLRMRKKSY